MGTDGQTNKQTNKWTDGQIFTQYSGLALTPSGEFGFLVCQYIIKDVQDLPQELRTHVTMFYKELITLMEGASESWRLITKEKYMMILIAMIHLHTE
jgi:hypothetical protein